MTRIFQAFDLKHNEWKSAVFVRESFFIRSYFVCVIKVICALQWIFFTYLMGFNWRAFEVFNAVCFIYGYYIQFLLALLFNICIFSKTVRIYSYYVHFRDKILLLFCINNVLNVCKNVLIFIYIILC